MTFRLNTQFSQTDLNRLYTTGTNLVIAKPTGDTPNVAWLVVRPLLNNSIQWEEEYGLYASNVAVENGATLSQFSQTEVPTPIGRRNVFGPAGFFGPSQTGGSQGSFTTENQFNNLPKGFLTFGLYQSATVDGGTVSGNAVSAAPVLFGSTATITPFTTVYIWTQSQVVGNSVVTNVTSAMTRATFGGPVEEISLVYDADTGTFITAPGVDPKAIDLQHQLPILA